MALKVSLCDDPEVRSFGSEVCAVATAPDSLEFCVGLDEKPCLSVMRVGSSAAETFDDHDLGLWCLTYTPDGSSVVCGSPDCNISVRFLRSPERRPIVLSDGSVANIVFGVAVSPDGRRVASATQKNAVKIWDIESGKIVLTFNGHRDVVNSVLFSRDGTAVFSGSGDKTVMKFEATTGRVMSTAKGHASSVYYLAISGAGDVLASGSYDHTIRIWGSQYGECHAV